MSNGTTTYPYWDALNRYIVAGPTHAPTVFAQIYQLPNSWWQVRCFGNRTNCPEKLGPFFGPISAAQSAIAAHCQNLHYIAQGGPPVAPLPPELISLSPVHSHINTAFTLTINGQNFTATSQIYFDGSLVTGTVFTSPQQLSCPIAATQIPQARYYSVRVSDPVGGSSNTLSFAATTAALALAAAPADPTTPSKIIVSHS